MERSGRRDARILAYRKHQLTPQDLLNFSEMAGFVDDWERLGLDVELDLFSASGRHHRAPERRCRGARHRRAAEVRVRAPRGLGGKKRGKRNSCRVCYVYFEEFHAVLLVTAYAKGRKEDITYEEKAIIKKTIARIHASLSTRHGS